MTLTLALGCSPENIFSDRVPVGEEPQKSILDYETEDPDHLLPAYASFDTWFDHSTAIRAALLDDVLAATPADGWKPLGLWLLEPALDQPELLVLQRREADEAAARELVPEFRLLYRRRSSESERWIKIDNVRFRDATLPLDKVTAEQLHQLWCAATGTTREPKIIPTGAIIRDGFSSYFVSYDFMGRKVNGIGSTITPTEPDKLSFQLDEFARSLTRFVEEGGGADRLESLRSEIARLANRLGKTPD